jgi:hypothetical protein
LRRYESIREAWRSYKKALDLDIPRTLGAARALMQGLMETKNIEFYFDRSFIPSTFLP